VHDLTARGIGFKVLTGHGASIDTTFPGGKLVFGIFAALADFERELIIERTKVGMAAARARGRNGGRPYKMAPSKLRLAVASMKKPETRNGDLYAELGITLRMRRSIRPALSEWTTRECQHKHLGEINTRAITRPPAGRPRQVFCVSRSDHTSPRRWPMARRSGKPRAPAKERWADDARTHSLRPLHRRLLSSRGPGALDLPLVASGNGPT
jgi:hypothetical protein